MSTRLCLSFVETPAWCSSKKIMFLLDKSSCRVVADLEHMIKKKFEIHNVCINLYMEGYLLPSQERIELVRDGDNLRVEIQSILLEKDEEDSHETHSLPKKQRVRHMAETEDIVPSKKQKLQTTKQKHKNTKTTQRMNEVSNAKQNGDAHGKQRNEFIKVQSKRASSGSTKPTDKLLSTSSKESRNEKTSSTRKPTKKTASLSSLSSLTASSSKCAKTSSSTRKPAKKSALTKTASSSSLSSLTASSSKCAKTSSSTRKPAKKSALTKTASSSSLSSSSSSQESSGTETSFSTRKPTTKALNMTKTLSSAFHSTLPCPSEPPKESCIIRTSSTRTDVTNAKHIHFDSDEEDQIMSNVSHQPSIQSLNKTNGQTQNHNSSHDINQSTTNDGHANNTDIVFTLAYDQQESFDVCNGTSVIPSHVQPIRKDVVDFSALSSLCGPPRAGDRIAYKVLEISASYTPEMSDYKEGVVLEYDPTTSEVLVELTPESLAKPLGDGNVSNKFELISGDEDDEDPTKLPPVLESKVSVSWPSMVDPRLITT